MVGGTPATARFVNTASVTNDKPNTAITAKVADAKVTNAPNTPPPLPLQSTPKQPEKQPQRAAITEKVTKRKTAIVIDHDTYRKHANAARASYSYYLRNDAERSLANAKKHIEILKRHGYNAKIEADTVIIDNYKKPTLNERSTSQSNTTNP